jgi:cytochrome o ubiquinol oxidase operon protein cyoD
MSDRPRLQFLRRVLTFVAAGAAVAGVAWLMAESPQDPVPVRPAGTGRAEQRRERRSYIIGFAFAMLMTCAAFAIVAWRLMDPATALAAVLALGLLQIVGHFRFFLHIDLRKSARDDLQLILFSSLITLLMVGGTLVILFNLRHRMM